MALSTLLVAVAGTAARVMMAATKVMAREEAEEALLEEASWVYSCQ